MREIKFKAWDNKTKRMIVSNSYESWYPFYIQPNGCVYIEGVLQDYILLQFTGLKDKDNVEIYEGDIVKSNIIKNRWWQIVYRTDSEFVGFLPYEMQFLDDKVYSPLSHFVNWKELVVVGNIYENPELMASGIGVNE